MSPFFSNNDIDEFDQKMAGILQGSIATMFRQLIEPVDSGRQDSSTTKSTPPPLKLHDFGGSDFIRLAEKSRRNRRATIRKQDPLANDKVGYINKKGRVITVRLTFLPCRIGNVFKNVLFVQMAPKKWCIRNLKMVCLRNPFTMYSTPTIQVNTSPNPSFLPQAPTHPLSPPWTLLLHSRNFGTVLLISYSLFFPFNIIPRQCNTIFCNK
ncbi:hypothetical protein BC941DRAFT_124939 [Chlamydoabsidia padenii]|nr:hypothetical protein BC941DRAFT_124939 [Chlamydoabsidia padenii]